MNADHESTLPPPPLAGEVGLSGPGGGLAQSEQRAALTRPRAPMRSIGLRPTSPRGRAVAHSFAFLMMGLLLNAVTHADNISILPGDFTLHGSEAIHRVSVVGQPDNKIGAKAAGVTLKSEDESIARVDGQSIVPVADGTTTITAHDVHGNSASIRVTVDGTSDKHDWSFRNDVQSVLARNSCNMGACHGALAGKGGFRLSLKGYDAAADHFSMTRQTRGRRVEVGDPGRSLVLAKPTGALPHKGGLRLKPDSRDYQVLSQWIASGAEGPSEEDPILESIRVSPEQALLHPGDESQIIVLGKYSDDRIVDVTHWAQFTATDEAVAGVDENGLVTVRGSGEAAVLVWFGSKVALARMTVPYQNEIGAQVYANLPQTNFVDELTIDQLSTLQLMPSPRCDDEAFLRRATLDTIGRLPTLAEQREYLDGVPTRRRDRLIERLLASEDFIDYWSYKWSDMLLINGNRLRPAAIEAYYAWVKQAVAANQPWDELVTEILTATGVSNENGATNFYALHQSPEDMTENAAQAFLGLSIGCAKCHNHPLEKWTNDQYYAMANMFSRVRAKGWGGDSRNGDGIRTLYVSTEGELVQPNTGKPQPPAPLDAPALDFDDPTDRRVALADWLTSPENPYFARSITNRIWANFFGRGLVEQVDDLRLSNPASNELLLNAASEFLVDADFDLKQLMREILRSETYSRGSVPLPQNADEQKYLSRYYPRRLMAEVMLDSIDQVLATTTDFNEIAFSGADKQKTDFYPKGTRAIELYDSAVNSYFLQTFGRNPREITCECERSDEQSMVQVLHMSNGDTLNPKLATKGNRIDQMMEDGLDDEAIIEKLFRLALVRDPNETELASMKTVIGEYGDDRRTALQDVAWSILTSTEFTFNH